MTIERRGIVAGDGGLAIVREAVGARRQRWRPDTRVDVMVTAAR
jgi:hypothetical protein